MEAADLHVVPEARPEGCAAPSKTRDLMALGEPFVAAVDAGSERTSVVAELDCVVWVPADDAVDLPERSSN